MDTYNKPIDNTTELVGNPETPLLRSALFYGLIITAIVIATTLMGYITQWNTQSSSYQMMGWVTMIGTAIWYIWHYKNKKNNGYLRYGQGVGLSTLTGLITGVLTGIFMYVYMKYINAGVIDDAMNQTYEKLVDQGLSDSQIEQTMEMTSSFMTPGFFAISTVVAWVVISLILGLIISAIMKRD